MNAKGTLLLSARLGALLLTVSCTKSSGDQPLPAATGTAELATSSPSAAITQDDAAFEGWLPLEVSAVPFVFDARWPECIHPGVVDQCDAGWCRIPAGCYIFGSPENTPGRNEEGEIQGPVTLTYDMEVMQTELTWSEYDRVTGWPRKIYDGECEDDQCPANVSWWEAMLFANLLSERHEPPLEACYDLGEPCYRNPGDRMYCPNYKLRRPNYQCTGYRLPNQFEWQYLARGGTPTDFYTGNMVNVDLGDCKLDPALHAIAWYCGNSPTFAAHPVGQLLPNKWGLYDVFGNVVETMQVPERWSPDYPAVDPVEPAGEGERLTDCAGGNAIGVPQVMQVAKYILSDFSGLRLVRTLGKGTLPVLDTD